MKTIKAFMLVALFAVTSFSANAGTDPNTSDNTLRSEILKMVKDIDLSDITQDVYKVEVHFMLNAKNEIVVLSTTSKELDQVIKSKLNYKRVNVGGVEQSKLYIQPISFKK